MITVWSIATAAFFAMHMGPGNPLTSDKDSPEVRTNLEVRYGLDKPFLVDRMAAIFM